MQTFCTIVSQSHLPFAGVLFQSLQENGAGESLQVLVVDEGTSINDLDPKIRIWQTEELSGSATYKTLFSKFGHRQTGDEFRWALKPVFISQLLNNEFEKVIYVDADVYFFSNSSFLFEDLTDSAILLTPHWRSIDPVFFDDLYALLKDGYFNAGFIGASRKGLPALVWWANACTAKMEKSATLGIYDDQKYLDLLPNEFDSVKVVTHRGCNIAYWNMEVNKREMVNGQPLINGQYEPVFVHFTTATMEHIANGNDGLLLPLLLKYKASFTKLGLAEPPFFSDKGFALKKNFIVRIKHKLLLRTRLKRFLYRLSQKL